jgi:hypothetical protein
MNGKRLFSETATRFEYHWRFELRRKISLFIIIIFLTGFAILNNGCSSSESVEYDDGDPSVSFNIDDANFQERLGKDDGYAFAIFYGADIHGSLETCG